MSGYVLAIDQGTTSTRAIVFDGEMKIAGVGPEGVHADLSALRLGRARSGGNLGFGRFDHQDGDPRGQDRGQGHRALGITNQRETVVVWERDSGKPIHNAIVWQDRRTASYCDKLKKQDLEKTFTQKTGLLLDPYFSGTKLSWMLANVKGARARAAKGEFCFGTIDTFLLWRLTGGKSTPPMRPMPRAR
jgi:glycerol kinase